MKVKGLALTTIMCLLCGMTAPAAIAEDSTDGYEEVTVRMEAEDIDLSQSFLDNATKLDAGSQTETKQIDGFSAASEESPFNALGAAHGDVYYLGEIETIDLVDIRFSVASDQAVHYVFFYGNKGQSSSTVDFATSTYGWTQLADVNANSGNWKVPKDFSCGKAPSSTGNKTALCVKVWTGGSVASGCGNLDYIDLIYSKPAMPSGASKLKVEAETATLTGGASAKTNTAFTPHDASPNFVGNTKPGALLSFGQRDLTGLVQVNIALASAYADDYEIYADDLLIGKTTAGPTSTNTNVFTLVKTFAVPLSNVPTGIHELTLKPIKGESDHGPVSGAGNIDYIELVTYKTMTVNFLGKYNEVFATETVSSADALKALLDGGVAPTVIPGYQFKGWNVSQSDCDALFDTNTGEPVNINAIYISDETTAYTLTIGANIAAVDAGDNPVTADTPLTFDTRVTATAEGAVAYWVLDGAKVGFNANSYTFYASGNNSIAVVLKDEAVDPLACDVVIQQAYAPDNGHAYTFAVIAQTSIPQGQLSEHGMIYSNSLNTLMALRNEETVDTSRYITVTSSKTAANKQYMTSLLNVQPDRYRYAIAYAVVDGNTIYSSHYVRVHTGTSAPEIMAP